MSIPTSPTSSLVRNPLSTTCKSCVSHGPSRVRSTIGSSPVAACRVIATVAYLPFDTGAVSS
jgi:hypothetical protein